MEEASTNILKSNALEDTNLAIAMENQHQRHSKVVETASAMEQQAVFSATDLAVSAISGTLAACSNRTSDARLAVSNSGSLDDISKVTCRPPQKSNDSSLSTMLSQGIPLFSGDLLIHRTQGHMPSDSSQDERPSNYNTRLTSGLNEEYNVVEQNSNQTKRPNSITYPLFTQKSSVNNDEKELSDIQFKSSSALEAKKQRSATMNISESEQSHFEDVSGNFDAFDEPKNIESDPQSAQAERNRLHRRLAEKNNLVASLRFRLRHLEREQHWAKVRASSNCSSYVTNHNPQTELLNDAKMPLVAGGKESNVFSHSVKQDPALRMRIRDLEKKLSRDARDLHAAREMNELLRRENQRLIAHRQNVNAQSETSLSSNLDSRCKITPVNFYELLPAPISNNQSTAPKENSDPSLHQRVATLQHKMLGVAEFPAPGTSPLDKNVQTRVYQWSEAETEALHNLAKETLQVSAKARAHISCTYLEPTFGHVLNDIENFCLNTSNKEKHYNMHILLRNICQSIYQSATTTRNLEQRMNMQALELETKNCTIKTTSVDQKLNSASNILPEPKEGIKIEDKSTSQKKLHLGNEQDEDGRVESLLVSLMALRKENMQLKKRFLEKSKSTESIDKKVLSEKISELESRLQSMNKTTTDANAQVDLQVQIQQKKIENLLEREFQPFLEKIADLEKDNLELAEKQCHVEEILAMSNVESIGHKQQAQIAALQAVVQQLNRKVTSISKESLKASTTDDLRDFKQEKGLVLSNSSERAIESMVSTLTNLQKTLEQQQIRFEEHLKELSIKILKAEEKSDYDAGANRMAKLTEKQNRKLRNDLKVAKEHVHAVQLEMETREKQGCLKCNLQDSELQTILETSQKQAKYIDVIEGEIESAMSHLRNYELQFSSIYALHVGLSDSLDSSLKLYSSERRLEKFSIAHPLAFLQYYQELTKLASHFRQDVATKKQRIEEKSRMLEEIRQELNTLREKYLRAQECAKLAEKTRDDQARGFQIQLKAAEERATRAQKKLTRLLQGVHQFVSEPNPSSSSSDNIASSLEADDLQNGRMANW